MYFERFLTVLAFALACYADTIHTISSINITSSVLSVHTNSTSSFASSNAFNSSSASRSASKTSDTTSHGVGFYVAAGLVASSSTSNQQSSSSTLPSSGTDTVSQVTSTSTSYVVVNLLPGPHNTSSSAAIQTSSSLQNPIPSISSPSASQILGTSSENGSVPLSQNSSASPTSSQSTIYITETLLPGPAFSSLVGANATNSATGKGPYSTGTSPYYNAGNATQPTVTGTLTGTAPSNFTGWPQASNLDICWSEWEEYWSMDVLTSTRYSTSEYWNETGATSTTTFIYTLSTKPASTWTYSQVTTESNAVVNEGFTIATIPLETISDVFTSTITAQQATTVTDVQTDYGIEITSVATLLPTGPPAPNCSLPSVYSQCEQQWDQWAGIAVQPVPQLPYSTACWPQLVSAAGPFGQYANGTPPCYQTWANSSFAWYSTISSHSAQPACTQASVTGALCNSLVDAYVSGDNLNLLPSYASANYRDLIFSQGFFSFAQFTGEPPSSINPTGWNWPTSQVFAPGCTLGCGRCAVTGGSIQLLYFPPGLSHPATGPVTVSTLGTVLTSPTYYISFSSVYASDACRAVGPTIGSTIVPFPVTDSLSSVWGVQNLCEFAGTYNMHPVMIETAPFNISDLLQSPVPRSIYTSQPFCQSQIYGDCNTDACVTTLPYNPIIVVPDTFLQQLDPAWKTCSADLRGLYDPPKSLTPVSNIAGPTLTPGTSPTVPATPGSTLDSPTVTATATAESATPTPAQSSAQAPQSEQQPSSTSPGTNPAPASIPASGSVEQSLSQAGASSVQPTNNNPSPSVKNPTSSATESTAATSSDTGAGIGSIIGSLLGASTTNADKTATQAAGSNPAQTQSPVGQATSKQAGSGDPATSANDPGSSANPGGVIASIVGGGGSSTAKTGAVVTLGSSVVTAVQQSSAIVVGSQTIKAGQTAVVNGQTVSAGSSGIIVNGGSTQKLSSIADPTGVAPSSAQTSGAVVTLGSQTFTAVQTTGAAVVAGQTLTPGQTTVINGQTVSAASSGLVINGATATFTGLGSGAATTNAPSQATGALLTLGSQTVTALESGGSVVVGGQTLTPGQTAVINGQTVTALATGVAAGGTVAGFSTIAVSPADPGSGSTGALLTLASGSTITAVEQSSGSGIVIAGQTLTPGQVTVINGQTVTALATGLAAGGTTVGFSALPLGTSDPGSHSVGAIVTLSSGSTLTAIAQASGTAVVNGHTLTPGQVTILNGQTVSDASSGIVVDGTLAPFSTLPAAVGSSDPASSGAIITLAPGSTVTAVEQGSGTVAFEGATLTPGQVTVISGHTVSDASTGLVLDGTLAAFSSLPSAVGGSKPSASGAVITLAPGQTVTAVEQPSGGVVFDGITLTPGEVTTINGHTISEDGSSGLVVDGTLASFSAIPTPGPQVTGALVTLSDGSIVTALEGLLGDIMFDGHTLTPGEVTVIDGETVSDASTALVVDGTTQPLSQLSVTSVPTMSTTATGSATFNGPNLPASTAAAATSKKSAAASMHLSGSLASFFAIMGFFMSGWL